MHVSESGAQRLVEQAARDGHTVAGHPPHRLITTEGTGQLPAASSTRPWTGSSAPGPSKSGYEINLINELATRDRVRRRRSSLLRRKQRGSNSTKRVTGQQA